MRICSRLVAGAVLAASTVVLVAVPALAARPGSTTSTTSTSSTTTTTSASSSTTTTTEPDGSTTTTSTTAPEGSTTTTTTAAPDAATATPSVTTTTTTLPEGVVPPEVQALIDAYPRTPAGATDDLVAALASLPPRAALGGFGRFPVAGVARWSHDWLFPRHTPTFHVHEGTDVFAERGTQVLAPAAGTARVGRGAVGGLTVKVVQDDGTWWYLAHLASVSVEDGATVAPGAVVGTVGDTGNAAGGPPHVHVEVHPYGRGPLDPKRLLDQLYAEALAAAPQYVAAHEARALLRADRLDPGPRPTPSARDVPARDERRGSRRTFGS